MRGTRPGNPLWWGLVLGALLCGCRAAGTRGWTAAVIFQAPGKLGGCAVGDADPDRPGNEIVSVCSNGEVFLTRREGAGWKTDSIAKLGGEAIQVAIGDADPSTPGNEIVAVGVTEGGEDDGAPGAATLIRRKGGGWKTEPIFEDRALIHGVCIESGSVFVAGYSLTAHRLWKADGSWKSEVVAALPGPGKNAVASRGGIVIACKDGSLVLVRKDGGWRSEVIHAYGAGRSRLGAAGDRVIVANDDGTLHLLEGNRARVIHAESSKLRGAVLADLDPDHPGLEAATAGYEMKMSVLYRNGKWRPVTVFKDTGRFHHLAAGPLPGISGIALVGCGYSGRLILAFRR